MSESLSELELRELGAAALQGLGSKRGAETKADTKAQEEEVISISRPDKTPEEAVKLSREERRRRIAQVLSRGVLNEKLAAVTAAVPPGKHGVLVRKKDEDILRYRNLGYEVETSGIQGLHGTGDGTTVVGDLILMTCDQENYEIIQEVKGETTRSRLEAPIKQYIDEAETKNKSVPAFSESQVSIKRNG